MPHTQHVNDARGSVRGSDTSPVPLRLPGLRRPLALLVLVGIGIGLGPRLARHLLDHVALWALQLGGWAPAVFLLAFSALAVVGVPRPMLALVGVIAFGPLAGGLLAWSGSFLAALAGFAAGRALRQGGPAQVRRAPRLVHIVGEHTVWAIVLARLSPLPFWLVNYSAGALAVRLDRYAGATAIGLVPSAVAYATIGGYATSWDGAANPLFPVVALACVLMLVVLWRRCRAGRLHIGTPEEPSRPAPLAS